MARAQPSELLGLVDGYPAGICPVVAHIWTPSWVLFSGGLAFLFLAGFCQVMDIWNRRAWAFPLKIVGMNSIAAYLISHLWIGFICDALPHHFGRSWIGLCGKPCEPFFLGVAVLTVEWMVLSWMARRKILWRV